MAERMAAVDLYVGSGQDLVITNLTGHPTVVFPMGFRERNGRMIPGSVSPHGTTLRRVNFTGCRPSLPAGDRRPPQAATARALPGGTARMTSRIEWKPSRFSPYLSRNKPMRPEDLFGLLDAQPFVPFRIHMTDGKFYDIVDPGAVLVVKTRAIVGLRPDPEQTLLHWIVSKSPCFILSARRRFRQSSRSRRRPRPVESRDRRRRGPGSAYSTIISPFMTIQWPGNVQR